MEIEERHNINDVFGYRKIVWKIQNYFAGTCGKDWVIRSPEFCVYSPKLTKWRLCLMPKRERENCSVTTYLERLEHDSFPDKVHVVWRLCYSTDEDKEVMSESSKSFLTNWAIGTEIPNIRSVEQNVFRYYDNFTIECHIIVYIADNPKLLEVSKDAGLKSLSQDLFVLCALERGCDTKVFVENTGVINVHKAIVCCRNSKLKRLIGNNTLCNINFPLKDLEGVKKLIRFLYTGDLKHVLRIPSFAIENAINYFGVEELKPYYSHDELAIETKVVVSEKRFVWTVSNVDKIEKGIILGHYMKLLACNEVFRLALHPRGSSGIEEHMSLQVSFSKGIQPRHLCIYCGLVGTDGRVHHIKCIRWFPVVGETILLGKFASRSALTDPVVMDKGKLKIFCKFRRSETVENEPVVDGETYPVLSVNKSMHYDILSKQFASLLEFGDYSDSTVKCKVLLIRVHKMIIGSRSHVLSKMFEADNISVSFPNMEPTILLIILRYLYSGVLKKCEQGEILKIYDAAKSFSIQSLANTCSNILREFRK